MSANPEWAAWLAADSTLNRIPEALRLVPRWVCWRPVGKKKPPVKADGTPNKDWQRDLLTFEQALDRLEKLPPDAGLGLVLGDGWGGLDLDDCRRPDGTLDPRAEVVLAQAPGYVEVSPSGTGVKVFGRCDGWLELNFGQPDKVAVNKKPTGYFTVTGQGEGNPNADLGAAVESLAGFFMGQPKTDHKAKRLPDRIYRGEQNEMLFREACRHRRDGKTEAEIVGILAVVAQSRCDPVPSQADLEGIAHSASRYVAGEVVEGEFTPDSKGRPAKTQRNVRLAIDKLGARLSHNTFSLQLCCDYQGHAGPLDDAVLDRLWLAADEAFQLLPPMGFFRTVIHDYARTRPFHPVLDYLGGLEWDGTPRVDTWLTTYGKAGDTPYVRAVGALFLVAAVRRVRHPGAKFDELMVWESEQGFDKSTALQNLCPRPEWFSDSLPLGADAKLTVEGTSGIWIIEAADLHARSRRDLDQLKAALSRQVDGPVRLAYGRDPVTVPRQWVGAGTTNKDTYLTDLTGNRRFWPVAVGRFDIVGLRRDRDQLWAEAAAREATGEPTRLRQELWPVAGVEQEARRVEDPWEEVLAEALGEHPGKVLSSRVWTVVGVPTERRTQADCERLGAVMKKLGFKRTTARDGGRVKRVYKRDSGDWLIPPGDDDDDRGW